VNNRPSIDDYYVAMLPLIASRATCLRRKVAAILVDKAGKLVSIGYNGVPVGMPHCIDTPCAGAADQAGDTTRCAAIHAEMNAVDQARASRRHAHTLYCSTTPCWDCAGLLIITGVKRVVATSEYADQRGVERLKRAGVTVCVEPTTVKPKVVCLCGSTRFKDAFDEATYQESIAGRIVLSVGFFMHATENRHGESVGATPEQKVALDELHKRKIDLADEIYVLNVDGYVGSSTRSEIEYAVVHNKSVRYLEVLR
jgi:deoxycytidylate deaminase